MRTLFVSPAQPEDTDERYTPPWIFDGLGLVFDTDPASPGAGDFVPARRKITALEDGLTVDWHGLVWLNPPFSNTTPWARRFIEHGQGVFLGPVSNAAWTRDLMTPAGLVWLVRDFAFHHPTHAGKRSNMPLFLAAFGDESVTALEQLATSGRHPGVLFRPITTKGDT